MSVSSQALRAAHLLARAVVVTRASSFLTSDELQWCIGQHRSESQRPACKSHRAGSDHPASRPQSAVQPIKLETAIGCRAASYRNTELPRSSRSHSRPPSSATSIATLAAPLSVASEYAANGPRGTQPCQTSVLETAHVRRINRRRALGRGWLRGRDLNPRPLGYEPNELPDCSTPHIQVSSPLTCCQVTFDTQENSMVQGGRRHCACHQLTKGCWPDPPDSTMEL